MTNVSPKGENNVDRKQKIAHIIKGKDAEHDIKHGTDGTKPEQIKKCIKGLQASNGIVDSSYTNYDDSPYGTDKEAKRKRKVERIERGMEIVVSPLLGTKGLDSGIGGSRTCHKDTKQRGIEGVDIVKMYDICIASQQLTHGIGTTNDDAKGQEH